MIGDYRKQKGLFCLIVFATVGLFSLVLAAGAAADAQLATSVIGSAGGQASSTNFVVKSTLGQSTPIGASASTNFEVGAGFWYQDPVAPSTIGDLTANLSESDILLEWSHARDNVAIDHYVIYRATQPYFEAAGGDSIGGTKGTTYLDLSAAGSTLTNYFYVVRAADPSRNLAEDSNQVGEFDRGTMGGPK
ncbi:MAG: hypothetical protein AMJ92_07055 [candidate division Zixibacteria bacterium SM23_81]|nr:MAG: hypothetical protein AMJ92_07055 [candidate division Zixibacteria bacterium SM23_81]